MCWFKRKKTDELKTHKKVKIGIALGGGGARGIGHIGALRAFEELGVKFDYLAGTSAGSIVGALYSFGLNSFEMEDILLGLKEADIRKKNWFFMPSSTENLEKLLRRIFEKDLVFSELKKPFIAVAVNIKNGKEVRIESGSVAKACCASSAVPGVFKPVCFDDMHLVDGGLANNVPADVVREMGANIVFAVDVNPTRGRGTDSLKLFSMLSQTVGVMMQANVENKLRFADLVIIPPLGEFSSTKLGDVKKMIDIGYHAVMDKKDEIIKLVGNKPRIKDKIIWQINTTKRRKNHS